MIEFIVTSDLRCPSCGSEDSVLAPKSASLINDIITNASSNCRFVADLGNLVSSDVPKEQALSMHSEIISRFKAENLSFFSVFGKEDLAIGNQDLLKTHDYAMRYRAFDVSDYRCIFLDTVFENEDELFVDDEQFAWLSRLLGKSHRPAIIFSNTPISLSDKPGENNTLKNSQALCELFAKSKKVVLVISTHAEKTSKSICHGVPYLNIPHISLGDTPSYAYLSVSSVGIDIRGFGSVDSYYIKNGEKEISTGFFSKIKNLFKKRK